MQDSPFSEHETQIVIDTLNNILERELAGVVRYMHYSFMVADTTEFPLSARCWVRPTNRECTRSRRVSMLPPWADIRR